MQANTIARKARNFKHWMLCPTKNQQLILSIYFKATKKRNYYNCKVPRKKAFLIQVVQNLKISSHYEAIRLSGYDLTINHKSKKQFLCTNNLESAMRQAASFYHKRMHKKNEKYKIAAEFYLNELIEENWLELTECLPCQAPHIKLEDENTVDLELYDRLSLLEL